MNDAEARRRGFLAILPFAAAVVGVGVAANLLGADALHIGQRLAEATTVGEMLSTVGNLGLMVPVGFLRLMVDHSREVVTILSVGFVQPVGAAIAMTGMTQRE